MIYRQDESLAFLFVIRLRVVGRVGQWFVCAYPAMAFISAFEINTPTQICGNMAVHSSNARNASAWKYTINLCAAALLVFSLRNFVPRDGFLKPPRRILMWPSHNLAANSVEAQLIKCVRRCGTHEFSSRWNRAPLLAATLP